jgi:2-keto-4-pentenoate hydratase/2-oxohepta-3-ene-1,7-dioic acid hydratase in catechol pathway
MKWVRYETAAGPRQGLLEGDTVEEIEGDMFGSHKRTGRRLAYAGLRLLPPLVPVTFYAAGVNYPTHFKKVAAREGKPVDLPKQSHIGYRAANALIAHGEAIVVPRDSSGKLQYEGELVAVIGRNAKNLKESDALSCVFGYTIGNDVSERGWQRADRTLWRAKNADTFKPMGPWIDTEVDLEALITVVRLNGREVSRFRTNDMIFGVAATIAEITRYITLHPGDMVWMGTDEPTLDMVAGDTVEVEISGLGVLRNPVRAE